MDVMEIRRGILGRDNSYIKNGLILWMDGIDKGNTAGAWIDKAAGHVFESVNGMTIGDNYIGLDSTKSQYLKNSTFSQNNTNLNGTIEIVVSDYAKGSIIFIPIGHRSFAFGFRASTNEVIWATTGVPMAGYDKDAKIFSFAYNTQIYHRALINGTVPSFGKSNYWDNYDSKYNYIGRRNNGNNSNFANAKIYSIRIYDHALTLGEMLHNQRVDNKRYKLGLNI